MDMWKKRCPLAWSDEHGAAAYCLLDRCAWWDEDAGCCVLCSMAKRRAD